MTQYTRTRLDISENGRKVKCIVLYQNGKIHRDNDEPAIISNDNTKYWYKHGILHRPNNKPAVISIATYNTWLSWYKYGKLHRDTDEPAFVITDNANNKKIHQYWYKYGLKHRTTGPAVIFDDGTIEYWLNGNLVTEYEMMFAK